ncbi:hypothetical protein HPB50_001522 [Hyalomma asiaticum]|uniref:Uncharacterized protein n=1 Tax=Hyalomma asiaticum TaxID=266040 RepID=A0ACB7SJE7_HYAAI|nr:hypothetical protein HPB50_001522 [Hyalomma asiaticum]
MAQCRPYLKFTQTHPRRRTVLLGMLYRDPKQAKQKAGLFSPADCNPSDGLIKQQWRLHANEQRSGSKPVPFCGYKITVGSCAPPLETSKAGSAAR